MPERPGRTATVNFFEVRSPAPPRSTSSTAGRRSTCPATALVGGRYYDTQHDGRLRRPGAGCACRTTRRRSPRPGPPARVRRQRVARHHGHQRPGRPAGCAARSSTSALVRDRRRAPGDRRWRWSLTGPDQLSETRHARPSRSPPTRPTRTLQCSIDGLPFAPCSRRRPTRTSRPATTSSRSRRWASPGEPIEQLAPALYEWEVVAAARHDAARHADRQGPAGDDRQRRRPVEFTGMDDQTLDLDLEFECLLDGVLLGSCSSVLTTPSSPACRTRSRSRRARSASTRSRSARSTRWATSTRRRRRAAGPTSTSPRPTPSIEIGPEEETEGTIAVFEFLGEDTDWACRCSTSSARSTRPTSRRARRRTRSRACGSART